MNALIVDDSRAIRRILSGMLTDIGFAVAEASHGKEALAHLQAHADIGLAAAPGAGRLEHARDERARAGAGGAARPIASRRFR